VPHQHCSALTVVLLQFQWPNRAVLIVDGVVKTFYFTLGPSECRSHATDQHAHEDEFAESNIPSFAPTSSSSKTGFNPLSRQPDWLAPTTESSSTHVPHSHQPSGQPDVSARPLAAPAKLPSLKGVPPAALPVPRRISGPAPGRTASEHQHKPTAVSCPIDQFVQLAPHMRPLAVADLRLFPGSIKCAL
jgi:hypothetical protein